MPKLRLMLNPQGIAVDVDDTMLIGACATELAAELGYALSDSAGTPIIYQLRHTIGGSFLPNDRRFCDLHLAPGTCLTLVSGSTNVLMKSAHTADHPAATQRTPLPRRQWSRRAFLETGIISVFALSGLGTGLAVALAQQHLVGRRSAATPLVLPKVSTTSAPYIISATPPLTFTGHQQTIRVVAWSPDGRYLASGGDDGQLLVWGTDGVIRQRVAYPATITALAWSPESKRLVMGISNQVTFLMALTGTVLASFPHDHSSTVTRLAWTEQNQQQVVSGALDQRAIVWQTMQQYQPQTIFTHHAAPIESVTWAANGQTIASSSQGGVVRVWSAESGQEVHLPYRDAPLAMRAVAFAPTDTQLAVGGDDGVIRFWNGMVCQHTVAGSGTKICLDIPKRLQTSHSAIRSLAWSPNARNLASGSNDGTFSIWNPAQDQKPLFTVLLQPNTPVYSLAWSPVGNQLATASGKTVILWNLHAA